MTIHLCWTLISVIWQLSAKRSANQKLFWTDASSWNRCYSWFSHLVKFPSQLWLVPKASLGARCNNGRLFPPYWNRQEGIVMAPWSHIHHVIHRSQEITALGSLTYFKCPGIQQICTITLIYKVHELGNFKFLPIFPSFLTKYSE